MSENRKSETGRLEEIRVVDRRGFTSEGERRHPDASPEEPETVTSASSPPTSVLEEESRTARRTRSDIPRSSAPAASAHFQNLVLNLARQAAANLGAAKNPLTGQIEIDIEGAQQIIDLLQALRDKTRGNLVPEEEEMVEGLIADLQMQYVTARSKASRTS